MEHGLDPALRGCLCFARQNPENLYFGEDDCHSTLHSFTTMAGHYGYLRRPASSCFYEQKNYYVFLCNLSCYCKRHFPDLVGLFGDNESA